MADAINQGAVDLVDEILERMTTAVAARPKTDPKVLFAATNNLRIAVGNLLVALQDVNAAGGRVLSLVPVKGGAFDPWRDFARKIPDLLTSAVAMEGVVARHLEDNRDRYTAAERTAK